LSKKPFLASGKLVGDYSLLVKYLEICHERAGECMDVLPSRSLLDLLVEEVNREKVSFADIVGKLGKELAEKINCGVVVEAYRAIYGVEASCEEVKGILLRQLVAWYLELAESLGLLKLRESWRME